MLFAFGYLTLLIFGRQVSGAHYNPCVTLAAFSRCEDNFSFSIVSRILLTLMYVTAQAIGSIFGAIAIGLYFFVHEPIYSSDNAKLQFPIISEYLGTTMMTVIYLS